MTLLSPSAAAPSHARKGDGMMVVVQDNDAKSLIIEQANERFAQMVGYQAVELAQKPFFSLLGRATADYLKEEMEYHADAPDLDEIMQRQREIRLRHQFGEEVVSPFTLHRLTSYSLQSRFQFVLPNEMEVAARRKVREFILLNLEGIAQMDPATELPDRQTAIRFLPLLSNYLSQAGISAAFAMLRMDRGDKSEALYGVEGCQTLIKHVAQICKGTFRAEDIVFAFDHRTLAIILIDLPREASRVVLSRLRGKIRNHHLDFGGKSNFSITVSIAFSMFDAKVGNAIFADTEDAILRYDPTARDGLIEVR